MPASAHASGAALTHAQAFVLNLCSTVLLIGLNKHLLSSLAWNYPLSLAGLHFLATALFSRLTTALEAGSGQGKPRGSGQRISPLDLFWFTSVSVLSIASLTVSLKVNQVGVYQLSKLSCVALIAALERVLLRKTFSRLTLASMAAVLFGVGLTTTGRSLEASREGLQAAATSVVSAACQQVSVAHLQAKYSLISNEFISQTFYLQSLVLLLAGPFVDRAIYGTLPTEWAGFAPGGGRSAAWLLASCLAAISVNYTQVTVIRTLSPTGFQVLGNAKTTCILFVGWAMFDGKVSGRTVTGQCIAVLGMCLYGYAATRPKAGRLEKGQVKNTEVARGGVRTSGDVTAVRVDLLKTGLLADPERDD